MNNIIEINNLTKTYGKNRGVTNLTLTVEEGEIFGFLGSNGAGKSTTIRSMLGFLHFKDGTIQIMGKDNKKHLIEIQKEIGYMPSEAMFYPSMKVSEVIRFAADCHKKNCEKEADKLCQRLQVDVSKRIDELSLGNRKKVSIVCAMQHKPSLYIFDEPTSGLDPLMQKEFFQLISERNQEGATCFLSSHVLSEIRTYCKKAAIIKEGVLIRSDTVENLAKTNSKRVRIKGLSSQLELKGIMDINLSENEMDFVYKGEIRELFGYLQTLPITDAVIEEPSLDEIFMHFYKEKESK